MCGSSWNGVQTSGGGPNSDTATWDPVAQRWLNDCAPQRCYSDDIGSWSTNELTVNWNAPLAQIANFAAEQVATTAATPSCEVEYTINGQWPGGFNAQILVRNTGDTPLEGLKLHWAQPTGQSIVHSWSVELVQEGHTVTATQLAGGAALKPGRTFTFGFIGTKDARTAVAPGSVTCSAA